MSQSYLLNICGDEYPVIWLRTKTGLRLISNWDIYLYESGFKPELKQYLD